MLCVSALNVLCTLRVNFVVSGIRLCVCSFVLLLCVCVCAGVVMLRVSECVSE